MEGHLQPECLGLVIEELFEVNPKWYTVGLMLGLHYSTLDTIKHLYNEEDYFREMLKSWFKHAQDCSWQALVRALTTSAVGEYALARKLERKYLHYESPSSTQSSIIKQSSNDEDYSDTLASPCSRTSSGSDVSTSKQDHKGGPPFGCGCGRCNINNFLDGRCPKPERSLSSFPYLNTAAMKATDILILKGRLYDEFCLITREFSKFRTAICESLIDREIPVQKLIRVLRDLRAFSHAHSDVPLLGSCWSEITAAKTIDDIFNITTDYVSFNNFQITEHIVDSLGTEQDKMLLSEYRKKRDEYCKRNIFECPSYSTLCVEETTLVMKVEGIEKYSMKHLAGLISYLSRALSIANHSLKLCTVEKGCVKLIFQVPQSIKDTIFPLHAENLAELMNGTLSVTLLKCGKWLYQFPVGQLKETLPYKSKGIYNHGLLSRQAAEQMLNSTEYDCFLIRKSERFQNHLVYSHKQKRKFTHILLEEKANGVYGLKGESEAYPSLDFFITNVARGFCLMPLDLQDIQKAKTMSTLKVEGEERPGTSCMSDYGVHDLDDNTGDYTDECATSGDSAVIMGCKLPYLTKPSPLAARVPSPETYRKLDLSTMDVVHPYASVIERPNKKTKTTEPAD